MDNSGFNNFEDIFRACGFGNINMDDLNNSKYNKSNEKRDKDKTTSDGNAEDRGKFKDKTTSDGNAQDRGHGFNFGCNDIPGGFQNVHPELFTVTAEILGNIMAGNMPFYVQNAVGNWFELVGQVILTYNSQQQYFQGGPGRYFNPIYYNVSNPFCNQTSTNTTEDNMTSYGISKSEEESSEGNFNGSSKKYSKKNRRSDDDIRALENKMEELLSQIQDIKEEINNMKNN